MPMDQEPDGGGGSGDTLSSATSADNTICRYDGTNNKTIQSSVHTIDDTTGLITNTADTTNIIKSSRVDGASNVSHALDTASAISTWEHKLLSIRNNGTEKAYFTYLGGLALKERLDLTASATPSVYGTHASMLEAWGGIHLATNTAYISGCRAKVTKTYTNFSAAALTNDISIYTLPIGASIRDVFAQVTTPFSGGTISAYTISVGISGSTTKYLLANDVFTGCDQTILEETKKGTALTTPGLTNVESFSATADIRAYATSTTANLDQATAGSVTFYIIFDYVYGNS